MEYIGGDKPASKKVGIGYAVLFLFPGAGTFLQLIGPRSIDPAILDFANHLSVETMFVALAYLLPGIVPGLIAWFLGRSALRRGNENGAKLMKMSIIITCLFLISQVLRGFYESM